MLRRFRHSDLSRLLDALSFPSFRSLYTARCFVVPLIPISLDCLMLHHSPPSDLSRLLDASLFLSSDLLPAKLHQFLSSDLQLDGCHLFHHSDLQTSKCLPISLISRLLCLLLSSVSWKFHHSDLHAAKGLFIPIIHI
jgi:hypothetical protein